MDTILERENERFKIELRAEADATKAFVSLHPKGQLALKVEDLVAILQERLSPECIDQGVLQDVVKFAARGEPAKERRVAKAKEALPGRDGKLLRLIKDFGGEVSLEERGGVGFSFADLHLFDNVTPGLTVARLYPAKEGTPGLNIYGKPILPEKAKELKISVDATLQVMAPRTGEEYSRVVAQAEGYLHVEGTKLSVKDELRVNGNLDFRFGNIDFIGTVKVSGDIQPNFSLVAKKDIQVAGDIRQAKVQSREGAVRVTGMVHESQLRAGTDVEVGIIHSGTIEARGLIKVKREALESKLHTEQSLHLEGGLLCGGSTYVVCGLEARRIGSEAQLETNVVLGSNSEVRAEYIKLSAKIEEHDKAAELIKLHLGPYAEQNARMIMLQPAHRARMEALRAKLDQINKSKLKLTAQREELLRQGLRTQQARVNVIERAFPGLKIVAAEKEFSLQEELQGPKSIEFDFAKGEFSVKDLEPLSCEGLQEVTITISK